MSLFNAYMALSGTVDAEVLRDERMARRTSYRIGGPTALLVVAHSYGALRGPSRCSPRSASSG